jgi:hypothetical protein
MKQEELVTKRYMTVMLHVVELHLRFMFQQ